MCIIVTDLVNMTYIHKYKYKQPTQIYTFICAAFI